MGIRHFASLVSFAIIFTLLLNSCKKNNSAGTLVNAPVNPTVAIDSINYQDATFLESLPDTTYNLADIYLDNHESVKDFLLKTDSTFLKNYPSLRISQVNSLAPADQLRLFLSRMTAMGNYLVSSFYHEHEAGSNLNEPKQTKLAYNPGSKDYTARAFATEGDCRSLKLYGLDCSGMIYVMTKGSWLPDIVPKFLFNVENSSVVAKWNAAFINSEDYKNLYVEDLGSISSSNIQFGDIIIWPKAPHMGFVIGGYVYMSNGYFYLPNCSKNIKMGPTTSMLTPGLLKDFGKGVYKIFRVKAAQTITDVDGNVYGTITIGNQTWLQENLRTTHYRNGESIPNVTDPSQWSNLITGAFCNYNNDINNVSKYGRLYNWYAVNDSRKLAPAGWHIPTDAEWTALSNFLGGESVAGGKMKATTLWYSPNTGATNESAFTGLPGGFRRTLGAPGSFDQLGFYGYWWSSSNSSTPYPWHRMLGYYDNPIYRSNGYGMGNGFSIRCVKD